MAEPQPIYAWMKKKRGKTEQKEETTEGRKERMEERKLLVKKTFFSLTDRL